MTANNDIHPEYGIPNDFLRYISPYIANEHPEPLEDRDDLIALWREGIRYMRLYLKDRAVCENIAAWTMSAGSHSSLVNDNDVFEAVHLEIGALEGIKIDEDALRKVEDRIAEAVLEIKDK